MFFPLHCTFHQRGKEIRQEEYERKENQEELLVKICCYCSVAKSWPTLYDPMDCKMPGFPVHHQLPEPAQTHVGWVGDAIQPSYPLLSPSPPALIFPSIRAFSNESGFHIRWQKYWSFSFSICPSNEYSVLISSRFDWLDLLAVQGTLKSLLQHHSSKASVLWCSALFMVQLSHAYMITGKTWYSHLCKNFSVCCDPHSQRL